jgi:hypothetical protein
MLERAKRAVRRLLRTLLSWLSLLAIPVGIGAGLSGYKTLGALLVLFGTLAYFLVDPILTILDLIPKRESQVKRSR